MVNSRYCPDPILTAISGEHVLEHLNECLGMFDPSNEPVLLQNRPQ